MNYKQQLDRWVDGESIHLDSGCCPDFSCCQPELQANKHEREVFRTAHNTGDNKAVMSMLGMFLGAAIAKALPDKSVHIAGENSGEA